MASNKQVKCNCHVTRGTRNYYIRRTVTGHAAYCAVQRKFDLDVAKDRQNHERIRPNGRPEDTFGMANLNYYQIREQLRQDGRLNIGTRRGYGPQTPYLKRRHRE